MDIEYEATYEKVNKDEIRGRLKKAGAVLLRPEFLQKRVVFNLPGGHEINGAWLRVRDEGDKITMSLKVVDGDKINNQRETMIIVDDFKKTEAILQAIGCEKKSYQESKRELWILDNTEITIDEWPFLDPFVEVEGKSEATVKLVSEKIGFAYEQALFCAVDTLYNRKYGTDIKIINNGISKIVFGIDNPFLK